MIVKRMWETGPLRQWAERAEGRASTGWIPYQSPTLDGYAGPYVCDECQEPVVGVYRQKSGEKWLCKACHVKVRPQSRHPLPDFPLS